MDAAVRKMLKYKQKLRKENVVEKMEGEGEKMRNAFAVTVSSLYTPFRENLI